MDVFIYYIMHNWITKITIYIVIYFAQVFLFSRNKLNPDHEI